MKLPLGDAIDKMTILTRKVYFGEEDAGEELNHITKSLRRSYGFDGRVIVAIIRLAQMNFEIWNLENDIRKGGEGKFSLEEIGKRAIEIRNLNRRRIRYKNEINKITKNGFSEVKTNHLSQ